MELGQQMVETLSQRLFTHFKTPSTLYLQSFTKYLNIFRATGLDAAQQEECNSPWLFLLLSAVISFQPQPCISKTLKDIRKAPDLTERQGDALGEY